MTRPVDCVIPAAPKDYSKLPHVIASIRRHIQVETIHVVAPSNTGYDLAGVVFHRDGDIIPFDRSELPWRPNWTFQQLIKLFQNVTDNNWYLVLDADIVVNKNLPLWAEDGRPILYLGRDQCHSAYFEFNQKILGFGQVYNHSFLSECTLYNKDLVCQMLEYAGLDLPGFWQILLDTNVGCCPAESELYGSYIMREHPDVYEVRRIKSRLGGKYASYIWSDQEIVDYVEDARRRNPDTDLIAIHSWEGRID